MRLSVIIPCLNTAATMDVQLRALARQSWSGEWEVIIADNGSTDQTVVVARRYEDALPGFRIVDASDRRGQPHALNVGVAASTGEAVVFCDGDDEVTPGWLTAMGQALLHHDFVACRLESRELSGPLGSSIQNRQEDGLNVYWYPPYLPHGGSGSLGVKRWVHEAVGGFDESMPAIFDTDYCFRIQLRGIPLHFVPDAMVHVRPRGSLSGRFRQAKINGEWNVALYKRYRSLGMPGLSLRQGIAGWIGLVRDVPGLRHRENWANWVWQLGWRIGRFQGSLSHRIVAF